MDALQPWYGYYFKLDDTYGFINANIDRINKNKKLHELFITWAFAKFMESRFNKKYVVGFPSYNDKTDLSFSSFIDGNEAADDLNFDTIITEANKPESNYRFQIKRYISDAERNTQTFFEYVNSKVSRYASDLSLHVIIYIETGFIFEDMVFAQLMKSTTIKVGCVYLSGVIDKIRPLRPFFREIYPTYDNKLWMPDPVENLGKG